MANGRSTPVDREESFCLLWPDRRFCLIYLRRTKRKQRADRVRHASQGGIGKESWRKISIRSNIASPPMAVGAMPVSVNAPKSFHRSRVTTVQSSGRSAAIRTAIPTRGVLAAEVALDAIRRLGPLAIGRQFDHDAVAARLFPGESQVAELARFRMFGDLDNPSREFWPRTVAAGSQPATHLPDADPPTPGESARRLRSAASRNRDRRQTASRRPAAPAPSVCRRKPSRSATS